MLMLNVKSKIFGIVQACTVFHNPLQYSISTRFPNTVSPDIQIRRLLIVVSRLNRFHFCCSSNHNNNIISKTICSVLYWAHSVLNSHNQNIYIFYVRAHSHCVWSPFHLHNIFILGLSNTFFLIAHFECEHDVYEIPWRFYCYKNFFRSVLPLQTFKIERP